MEPISFQDLRDALQAASETGVSSQELGQLVQLAKYVDDPETAMRDEAALQHAQNGWVFGAALATSGASAISMPVIVATAPVSQAGAEGVAIASVAVTAIVTAGLAAYVYRRAGRIRKAVVAKTILLSMLRSRGSKT